MDIKFGKSQVNAQRLLNIIWAVVTSLFLIFAVYYEWQQYHSQKQQQLQFKANQVAEQLNSYYGAALDYGDSIPVSKLLGDCVHELIPLLHTIVFNNAAISAAMISDENNNIICSTLLGRKNLLPPPPPPQQLVAIYPIVMGVKKLPTLLIIKKTGTYYFGIYTVKELLHNLLASAFPTVHTIILYDDIQKRVVWSVGGDPFARPLLNFAKAPISSLQGYSIIIAANQEEFKKNFFWHQLLYILALFLILFWLYFKIHLLLSKRFSLHSALENALKCNEFFPAYQPIINYAESRCCGMEVLLRWHNGSEEILPDSFIAEAEKTDLIIPITLQLIEKSFKDCHELLNRHPDFHLGFNLCSSHFYKEEFFNQLNDLMEKYKISSKKILFELTERELLDQNNTQLIEKMNDMRNQGFSLAIDDFGTGHASIKYLQHFPFNYLKIDKIFIHAIGTGAITETLNEAIIKMANLLDLTIIAEGVETIEQVNVLHKNNIKLMQGWYFARAMSYNQLSEFLKEAKWRV